MQVLIIKVKIMNINILKEIILEQQDTLKKIDKGIERERLHEIQAHVKSSHIIIITGIRRCGKSTLLHQIIEKYYDNNACYYFNFEDERLLQFKVDDFNKLYEAFLDLFGERNVFFFDEIQNVDQWEMFIRRMHDAGKKIYLTGSNAAMLSREIGTRLTGRNITVKLSPFSFIEYATFKDIEIDKNTLLSTSGRVRVKKCFQDYLSHGGLPEYLKYNDIEIIKSLYNDIIYRDIAARYDIKDIKSLRNLSYYLVNNITTGISYNRLASMLGLGSVNTVKKYIEYLENSFLFSFTLKFDPSIRKQMMNQRRVYVVDNGFAKYVSINIFENRGVLLENFVFNALQRKYKTCYYYKTKSNKEVDFYIIDDQSNQYLIQVTESLQNETTRKRETMSLFNAMAECQLETGLILTKDEEEIIKGKGLIHVMPVYKWKDMLAIN
jgi:hypothetical protein